MEDNEKYIVYYGEYTLKYWIDMILKSEITLPSYQRDFVWSEKKVQALIRSLSNGQFIPSIIIGTYTENATKQHHYVLDGQQRLSAILLAWLGYFPAGKDFARDGNIDIVFGNYNDDKEESEDEDNGDDITGWSFKKIQEFGERAKEKIINKIVYGNQYKKMNIYSVDDDFLESKKMSFSYIKPKKDVTDIQQKKYFSTLFRNINISSVDLTPIESRASLYWLDANLKTFFQPENGIGKIKINNDDLDFARYLALLSQYNKNGSSNGLLYKYAKKIEEYIEEYIYFTVGEHENEKFSKLPEGIDCEERITKLNAAITGLNFDKVKYDSIIIADLYFFGLIYSIIFSNKAVDISKKEELEQRLLEHNSEFKADPNHAKSPNANKYIISRIDKSINIYSAYQINE